MNKNLKQLIRSEAADSFFVDENDHNDDTYKVITIYPRPN